MSDTRERYLACGYLGWFLGAGFWTAYVVTDDALQLWVASAFGGIGSILLILALVEPRMKPEPSPPKEPTPSFPASFFMPFCACPKCKVEALHWMKSSKIDMDDEEALLDWFDEVVVYNRLVDGLYSTREAMLTQARAWATNRSEVTRTCRECGHTWGQNVGLQNGG